MIGLLQRVTEAHVEVDGRRTGTIGPGLLVLACAREPFAGGERRIRRAHAGFTRKRRPGDDLAAGQLGREATAQPLSWEN